MSRNCPRGDSIKNWRAQEPRVKYFLFSGNENREKETVPLDSARDNGARDGAQDRARDNAREHWIAGGVGVIPGLS